MSIIPYMYLLYLLYFFTLIYITCSNPYDHPDLHKYYFTNLDSSSYENKAKANYDNLPRQRNKEIFHR